MDCLAYPTQHPVRLVRQPPRHACPRQDQFGDLRGQKLGQRCLDPDTAIFLSSRCQGRCHILTAGKIEALVEELREEGLLKTITYSHGGTGLGLSVTGSALVHRAQTDSQ